MKWSENQLLAIEERDKNILVSAAAGSGKTAVLVERIKQLMLKDKVDIDRMLILTFTNAAAGEMRERIYKTLSDELSQCNNPSDERFLSRQLDLIYAANISTFHSFCIEILRKNFYKIDIEPNFKICDEAQKSILENEALDQLLEEKFEESDEIFIGLLDRYCNEKNYNGIKEMIMDTYQFIQSIPNPLKWLEESIDNINSDEEQFIKSKMFIDLKKSFFFEIEKARRVLRKAIHIAGSPGGPYYYERALLNDLEQIAFFEEKLIHNDFDKLYNSTIQWMTLSGKKDDSVPEMSKTIVKKLRDEVKKTIKKIEEFFKSKSMKEYSDDLAKVYPYAKGLFEMVKNFDCIFTDKKKEKNLLDFNDLEHLAIKILEDKNIANKYRKKYSYIFIDEYQDSNIVQETIINSIKKDNNLFMVGDVKQSIYRFRLADPSLFIGRYEEYKKGQDGKNLKIDLNQNFRSKVLIINGINYLFSSLMKKGVDAFEYDKDAYLYRGLSYEEKYDVPIEVEIVEHDEKSEDIDEAIKDMMKAEVEALRAAEKIEENINTILYDNKKGKERKVKYKDIVILLRTIKGWVHIYEEVLEKKNIPVYVDGSESFFETIEIGIILNIIELINNKKQDIPLLSLMRSPIGEFTTEEIVNIRLYDKNVKFFESFEGYMYFGSDKELVNKCKVFMDKIKDWQRYSTYLRVDELLWKVLKETGFLLYISALPGYRKRQGNIYSLLEKARQFEDANMGGLIKFLKFIEESKKSGLNINVAKVMDQNDDMVKIMSIHKSKGLEFPLVIVGGLGKTINKRASSSKIIFNREIGMGMRYVAPEISAYTETIIEKIIKKRYEKELIEEELRILYVALSRAEDKLILLGTISDASKSFLKWQVKDEDFIYEASTYLDFIIPLLLKHKDCGPYFGDFEKDIFVVDYKEEQYSKWKVNIKRTDAIEKEIKHKKHAKEEIKQLFFTGWDREDFNEIREKLSWQYHYKNASRLPSKMTVTEVRRLLSRDVIYEEIDVPNVTAEPAFILGSHKYTAMERGIFIHKIMQYININKTDNFNDIKEQIGEIIKNQILRKEEAEIVEPSAILNFFKSDIGQRMKRSKEVFREIPFNLRKPAAEIVEQKAESIEEIIIQGTIDCYFKEEDDYILIDYKSDYISKSSGKSLEDIKGKYKIQLDLYKEALENIKGIKVKEVYLYLLSVGESIKIY